MQLGTLAFPVKRAAKFKTIKSGSGCSLFNLKNLAAAYQNQLPK